MAGQQEPADDKVYCVRCGAENRAIALYCESCGQLLGDTPTSAREWSLGGTRVETGPFQPKGLADLVTETFNVYSHSFRAFFTISLIPLTPAIALNLLLEVVPGTVGALVVLALSSLISLLLVVLVWGAIVHAVALSYLGHRILVAQCYGRAWNRVVSLVVVVLLLAAVSVPLLYLSIRFPLFVVVCLGATAYLLVRWFLSPQAILIESHRSLNSLRRSAQLVQGTWWRVFGLGVAFLLVSVGVSLVLSIPGLIIGLASPLLGDILITTAGVVASPVLGIGATVVYFDLRARKEGFDLARLQEEMGDAGAERGFA